MTTLRTGCRDLPLPLLAHLGARVLLSPPHELQDERVDVRGPGACLLLVSSEGRSLVVEMEADDYSNEDSCSPD